MGLQFLHVSRTEVASHGVGPINLSIVCDEILGGAVSSAVIDWVLRTMPFGLSQYPTTALSGLFCENNMVPLRSCLSSLFTSFRSFNRGQGIGGWLAIIKAVICDGFQIDKVHERSGFRRRLSNLFSALTVIDSSSAALILPEKTMLPPEFPSHGQIAIGPGRRSAKAYRERLAPTFSFPF